MAIDPKLMQVMGGGGAEAPASTGEPSPTGPVGQGMTTPQQNDGAQAQAMISVTMALDLLEKALPSFGSESQEGMAVLKALSVLTKLVGAQRQASQELVPAELRALMEATGMKSPEQMGAMGAGGQPASPMPMAA